jgi:hypothetical protein
VADFENSAKLTEYLKYLSQNLTAYAEYFWWTKFYEVQITERICATCELMHQIRSKRVETHRIKDFNQYWINEAHCNDPETSPWGKPFHNWKLKLKDLN